MNLVMAFAPKNQEPFWFGGSTSSTDFPVYRDTKTRMPSLARG